MYCPQCGTPAPDDRKFCTACGLNLALVSDVLVHRSGSSRGSAWPSLIEMIFGKQREPTPEERRVNDIRNGIITTLTGVGITLFLYFLMTAVAARPDVRPEDAPILRAVAWCGIIPVMVGIGMLINGLLFGKLGARPRSAQSEITSDEIRYPSLPSAQTTRIPPSVTEHTTLPLDDEFEPLPRPKE